MSSDSDSSLETFGKLFFFRKNEENKGTEYPLYSGETTIGASVDADVRLKLADERLGQIHCIIDVKENGKAIIINKSDLAPVTVNSVPVKKNKVLIDKDMLEVLGKKFQYFAEQNVEENPPKRPKLSSKLPTISNSRHSVSHLVHTKSPKVKTKTSVMVQKKPIRRKSTESSGREFMEKKTPTKQLIKKMTTEKFQTTSKLIGSKALSSSKSRRLSLGNQLPRRQTAKISSRNIMLKTSLISSTIQEESSKATYNKAILPSSNKKSNLPVKSAQNSKNAVLRAKTVSPKKSNPLIKPTFKHTARKSLKLEPKTVTDIKRQSSMNIIQFSPPRKSIMKTKFRRSSVKLNSSEMSKMVQFGQDEIDENIPKKRVSLLLEKRSTVSSDGSVRLILPSTGTSISPFEASGHSDSLFDFEPLENSPNVSSKKNSSTNRSRLSLARSGSFSKNIVSFSPSKSLRGSRRLSKDNPKYYSESLLTSPRFNVDSLRNKSNTNIDTPGSNSRPFLTTSTPMVVLKEVSPEEQTLRRSSVKKSLRLSEEVQNDDFTDVDSNFLTPQEQKGRFSFIHIQTDDLLTRLSPIKSPNRKSLCNKVNKPNLEKSFSELSDNEEDDLGKSRRSSAGGTNASRTKRSNSNSNRSLRTKLQEKSVSLSAGKNVNHVKEVDKEKSLLSKGRSSKNASLNLGESSNANLSLRSTIQYSLTEASINRSAKFENEENNKTNQSTTNVLKTRQSTTCMDVSKKPSSLSQFGNDNSACLNASTDSKKSGTNRESVNLSRSARASSFRDENNSLQLVTSFPQATRSIRSINVTNKDIEDIVDNNEVYHTSEGPANKSKSIRFSKVEVSLVQDSATKHTLNTSSKTKGSIQSRNVNLNDNEEDAADEFEGNSTRNTDLSAKKLLNISSNSRRSVRSSNITKNDNEEALEIADVSEGNTTRKSEVFINKSLNVSSRSRRSVRSSNISKNDNEEYAESTDEAEINNTRNSDPFANKSLNISSNSRRSIRSTNITNNDSEEVIEAADEVEANSTRKSNKFANKFLNTSSKSRSSIRSSNMTNNDIEEGADAADEAEANNTGKSDRFTNKSLNTSSKSRRSIRSSNITNNDIEEDREAVYEAEANSTRNSDALPNKSLNISSNSRRSIRFSIVTNNYGEEIKEAADEVEASTRKSNKFANKSLNTSSKSRRSIKSNNITNYDIEKDVDAADEAEANSTRKSGKFTNKSLNTSSESRRSIRSSNITNNDIEEDTEAVYEAEGNSTRNSNAFANKSLNISSNSRRSIGSSNITNNDIEEGTEAAEANRTRNSDAFANKSLNILSKSRRSIRSNNITENDNEVAETVDEVGANSTRNSEIFPNKSLNSSSKSRRATRSSNIPNNYNKDAKVDDEVSANKSRSTRFSNLEVSLLRESSLAEVNSTKNNEMSANNSRSTRFSTLKDSIPIHTMNISRSAKSSPAGEATYATESNDNDNVAKDQKRLSVQIQSLKNQNEESPAVKTPRGTLSNSSHSKTLNRSPLKNNRSIIDISSLEVIFLSEDEAKASQSKSRGSLVTTKEPIEDKTPILESSRKSSVGRKSGRQSGLLQDSSILQETPVKIRTRTSKSVLKSESVAGKHQFVVNKKITRSTSLDNGLIEILSPIPKTPKRRRGGHSLALDAFRNLPNSESTATDSDKSFLQIPTNKSRLTMARELESVQNSSYKESFGESCISSKTSTPRKSSRRGTENSFLGQSTEREISDTSEFNEKTDVIILNSSTDDDSFKENEKRASLSTPTPSPMKYSRRNTSKINESIGSYKNFETQSKKNTSVVLRTPTPRKSSILKSQHSQSVDSPYTPTCTPKNNVSVVIIDTPSERSGMSSKLSKTFNSTIEDDPELTTPKTALKGKRPKSLPYRPITEDISPASPIKVAKDDSGFKTPFNTPGLFENIRDSVLKSRSRLLKSTSDFSAELSNETQNQKASKRPRESTSTGESEKMSKRRKIGLNKNKSSLSGRLSFTSFHSEDVIPELSKLDATATPPPHFENLTDKPVIVEPETRPRKRSRKLKAQKSPKNDLSDVAGLKRLLKTPKEQKSPKNDLTNFAGVKKLFSNQTIETKSPKNDLTNVAGVKKLMTTPKTANSPKNDLTNVAGVKKLFANTVQMSPKNDLRNVAGVKKLLRSPKPGATSPKNDLSNVAGVKQLFSTPVQIKSPKNDLRNVPPLKRLMRTPRDKKAPKNDLTDVTGVRKLMSTPKEIKSPKNDLKNIVSIRKFMSSPKLMKSPNNDLSDVGSLDPLFVEHRNSSDQENSEDLFARIFDKKPLKTYRGKSLSPFKADGISDTRKTLGDVPITSPRVENWVKEQAKLRLEQLENERKQKKSTQSQLMDHSNKKLINAEKNALVESNWDAVDSTSTKNKRGRKAAVKETATPETARTRRKVQKEDEKLVSTSIDNVNNAEEEEERGVVIKEPNKRRQQTKKKNLPDSPAKELDSTSATPLSDKYTNTSSMRKPRIEEPALVQDVEPKTRTRGARKPIPNEDENKKDGIETPIRGRQATRRGNRQKEEPKEVITEPKKKQTRGRKDLVEGSSKDIKEHEQTEPKEAVNEPKMKQTRGRKEVEEESSEDIKEHVQAEPKEVVNEPKKKQTRSRKEIEEESSEDIKEHVQAEPKEVVNVPKKKQTRGRKEIVKESSEDIKEHEEAELKEIEKPARQAATRRGNRNQSEKQEEEKPEVKMRNKRGKKETIGDASKDAELETSHQTTRRGKIYQQESNKGEELETREDHEPKVRQRRGRKIVEEETNEKSGKLEQEEPKRQITRRGNKLIEDNSINGDNQREESQEVISGENKTGKRGRTKKEDVAETEEGSQSPRKPAATRSKRKNNTSSEVDTLEDNMSKNEKKKTVPKRGRKKVHNEEKSSEEDEMELKSLSKTTRGKKNTIIEEVKDEKKIDGVKGLKTSKKVEFSSPLVENPSKGRRRNIQTIVEVEPIQESKEVVSKRTRRGKNEADIEIVMEKEIADAPPLKRTRRGATKEEAETKPAIKTETNERRTRRR